MKAENGYSDFEINEKDFRMWVFDRHNSEDSAIFEPVKAPDKNKLIEQIPAEYTELRDFIANSNTDKLAQELTEKRKQRRQELEQEYIKEMLAAQNDSEKQNEDDDFDIKSKNLRNALLHTYENTDARISFSSSDYSHIKKEKSNRQKQDSNNTDKQTDEEILDSQLKRYKTANICLISLIFALLIFFVGQRYIERNGNNILSILDPIADTTNQLQEITRADSETELQETTSVESATENVTVTTEVSQESANDNSKPETTSNAEKNSLININTASAKELQSLEGIGEVKAANIIEYRETYGGFSSKRDILKVSGIGEKTYEKIKDKITVE